MSKRKYTKCECCPCYAKKGKKWECRHSYCAFDGGLAYEQRSEIIDRWIKANNGGSDNE